MAAWIRLRKKVVATLSSLVPTQKPPEVSGDLPRSPRQIGLQGSPPANDRMTVRFPRHNSGVRWQQRVPLSAVASRGTGAIGAPSAGLSLGELRARRAHLRFARHGQAIQQGLKEQE